MLYLHLVIGCVIATSIKSSPPVIPRTHISGLDLLAFSSSSSASSSSFWVVGVFFVEVRVLCSEFLVLVGGDCGCNSDGSQVGGGGGLYRGSTMGERPASLSLVTMYLTIE